MEVRDVHYFSFFEILSFGCMEIGRYCHLGNVGQKMDFKFRSNISYIHDHVFRKPVFLKFLVSCFRRKPHKSKTVTEGQLPDLSYLGGCPDILIACSI